MPSPIFSFAPPLTPYKLNPVWFHTDSNKNLYQWNITGRSVNGGSPLASDAIALANWSTNQTSLDTTTQMRLVIASPGIQSEACWVGDHKYLGKTTNTLKSVVGTDVAGLNSLNLNSQVLGISSGDSGGPFADFQNGTTGGPFDGISWYMKYNAGAGAPGSIDVYVTCNIQDCTTGNQFAIEFGPPFTLSDGSANPDTIANATNVWVNFTVSTISAAACEMTGAVSGSNSDIQSLTNVVSSIGFRINYSGFSGDNAFDIVMMDWTSP